MSRFLPLVAAIGGALAFGHAAYAQLAWSDDYSGQTVGAFPTLDYPGGVPGPDYFSTVAVTPNANFTVDGTVGSTAPGLVVIDTGTAAADVATLQVTMDHFAPFDVSALSLTPILRVSFDFRVDSYLSAVNTNIPRFILRADNVNNTGSQLVIGFGRAILDDGEAVEDLALYADTATGGTTSLPPKNSSSVGLIPGIGWQAGFDFGDYNAADATTNDTNDEFFRFSFDYNSVSGAIAGSVTRLSNGQSVSLPAGLSLTAETSFSNSTPDRFLLSSSAGNTATAYFDNFRFQAVPEPTGGFLAVAGLGLVGSLRRRRR